LFRIRHVSYHRPRPIPDPAPTRIAGRVCRSRESHSFYRAFVDGLDLTAVGFIRVASKVNGRLGYAPKDLLKFYIYGYLNRVHSSRRLEVETYRNIEVSSLSIVQTSDLLDKIPDRFQIQWFCHNSRSHNQKHLPIYRPVF
jgi:hypothetical protein